MKTFKLRLNDRTEALVVAASVTYAQEFQDADGAIVAVFFQNKTSPLYTRETLTSIMERLEACL